MRIKGLDSNLIEIQLVLIALGLELGRVHSWVNYMMLICSFIQKLIQMQFIYYNHLNILQYFMIISKLKFILIFFEGIKSQMSGGCSCPDIIMKRKSLIKIKKLL